MKAWPGLGALFASANLDPAINTWDKVFDFNATADESHWSLYPSPPTEWTVITDPGDGLGPIEGTPDCPVLSADGRAFDASAASAPAPAFDDAFAEPAAAPPAAPADDFFGSPAAPAEDPFAAPAPAPAPAAPMEDMFAAPAPPVSAAPSAALASALSAKAAEEAQAQAESRAEAEEFLRSFYAKREIQMKARFDNNRAEEAATAPSAEAGDNAWERVVGLVDFGGSTELPRFKSALFAAKARALAL